MAAPISYMGTKRQLAGVVAGVVADCRDGPFMDLFSGMCSVGSAVSPKRQIWSNDLQCFAQNVARARFCEPDWPLTPLLLTEACNRFYVNHSVFLHQVWRDWLAAEDRAFESGHDKAGAFFDACSKRAQQFQLGDRAGHYDLFVSRYGGTYISHAQAIEIDSLRKALDSALDLRKIRESDHRRAVLALCVALGRCATTTGHLAQPLAPKKHNFSRYLLQRRKSIYGEWIKALDSIVPEGTSAWRRGNQSFRSCANELLKNFSRTRGGPRVVYADPPYTKDQYSRFYHLYETLVLYDYPGAAGSGLYREKRATSDFSLASKVAGAIDGLIEGCARISADLILSYPQNGLLPDSESSISKSIKKHYGTVPVVLRLDHIHSSMGASKGDANRSVTEHIYLARSK